MYRAVTASVVGDGAATSFWSDRWLPIGRLAEQFPLLFSHASTADVSVASVLGDGIEHCLVPRLTTGAREELAALRDVLRDVQLSAAADRRTSPLSGEDGGMRAGPIYRLSMQATGAN